MQLRRRVTLAGVQLDSVDNRILIQSVEVSAGKDQISAVPLSAGSGSRVTATHRDSLDITVKFTINEKSYNLSARAAVLEAVNSWAAGGGWLSLNYKSGRKIRVMCAQLAAEGDAGKRGTEYSVVFRAYGVPWWQASDTTLVSQTGISTYSGSVTVPGQQETVADVSFKNTSNSTTDTLSITVSGSSMSFSGLGLEKNETLEIEHIDNGQRALLRIRIKNTSDSYRSVMDKRSAGSADDLYVMPGSRNISFSAANAGNLTITCAARYA